MMFNQKDDRMAEETTRRRKHSEVDYISGRVKKIQQWRQQQQQVWGTDGFQSKKSSEFWNQNF
jgi:hypothetical protein